MKLTELHQIRENEEEKSVLSAMGKQPDVYSHFECNNRELTSLVGCPKRINGRFNCSRNKLASLEGAPSYVREDFYCIRNDLTSLHNIHKLIKHVGQSMNFLGNPIKSHVLGLLLIDGLDYVVLENQRVSDILNKYLESDRDMFACQEELIEAGFEEFAQL